MAWTKVKTAVVGAVIVAGMATTTVVIQHRANPRISLDRDTFAYAGYQTPQATMQTMAWAMSKGDWDAFLACCAPEEKVRQGKVNQGKSKETISAEGKQQLNGVTGIKLSDQTTMPDGRIVLTVSLEGSGRTEKMAFRKIGDEWKLAR